MQGEDDKIPKESLLFATKSKQQSQLPYMPPEIRKLTGMPEALPKYIRRHLDEHKIHIKETFEPLTRPLKPVTMQSADFTLHPNNEGLHKQMMEYQKSLKNLNQKMNVPTNQNSERSLKQSQSERSYHHVLLTERSEEQKTLPLITHRERDKMQRESGPLLGSQNLFLTDAATYFEPKSMPYNRKVVLETVKMSRSPINSGTRLHSSITEILKQGFNTLPTKNRMIIEKSFEIAMQTESESPRKVVNTEPVDSAFMTQGTKEVDVKSHMESLKEKHQKGLKQLKKVSRVSHLNEISLHNTRRRRKMWKDNVSTRLLERTEEIKQKIPEQKAETSLLSARQDYLKVLHGESL